jgi:hypothetical protein
MTCHSTHTTEPTQLMKRPKLPSNSGATWSAAEKQWIEEHELAWRAHKQTSRGTKDFRQHTKRDWAARARAFADRFGRTRGVQAIRKAVETLCKAHPAQHQKWTAVEESWLAEQVPADAHLVNSYLQVIARAFEDQFNYKRTASSIRYKIEDLCHRACEDSWAACLQAPLANSAGAKEATRQQRTCF